MNILFLNKFFYLQGGAERVFFEEMELFRSAQHRVIPFSRKNPENVFSKYDGYFAEELFFEKKLSMDTLGAVKEIIYSNKVREPLTRLLDNYPIDVAHCHNIYGLLTTSVLDELYNRQIPVVLSLHDYKIICPNYHLFCNGEVCEACKPNRYYHALLKKCVHGNIFYSGIYCLENYFNHITGKYRNKVSKYIAVSKFIKNKFIEFGFPEKQIVHIPNFINTQTIKPSFSSGEYILYLGRISKEKGIKTLIDACLKTQMKSLKLVVAGTGPMINELALYSEREGLKNIEFKGYLTGNDLETTIQGARCIVVPSECNENCPMSVLEAFAYGKPVVGANIGGVPELIEHESDGLIFESGDSDDLAEQIEKILAYPEEQIKEMGRRGREKIETEYNAQTHYEKLMGLYQSLIEGSGK